MLDDTTGSFALRFALAALVVALALAAFFAIVTLIRRRNPGSMLGSGGFLGQARGRQSRLKVMDSVALDARRRLVLIRRDNVEHLLLIGGPADVIVENGLDAPYEPREAVVQDNAYRLSQQETEQDDFALDDFDEEEDDTVPLAPEPQRQPEPKPAAQAPLRESLRSMFRRGKPEAKADATTPPGVYREWEDDGDEDDFADDALDLAADLFGDEEFPRRADEPPTGTIRPVTIARDERLGLSAPTPPAPARPVQPVISAEEAAIARELENARRRLPIPGPNAPVLPQSASPASDFNRVLEQEMEEKLEAAKRQAQAAPIRPVVQQPRRDPALPRITGATNDPRAMDTGLTRIFGETPKSTGDR